MTAYRIFILLFWISVGFLVGGPAISRAQTQPQPQPTPIGQVFFVDVTVTKDLAVTPNLVRIAAGEPSNFEGVNSTYQAQLVSLDGAILYTTAIPVDFRVYDSPTINTTSQVRLALKLPYFLTAQSIKLLKQGAVFGRIDLAPALCPTTSDSQCSEFCALKKIDPDCFRCGNGLCEPNESAAACPTDCSTVVIPAPRPKPDFTPLLALAILGLAGAGIAGWQYLRRGR